MPGTSESGEYPRHGFQGNRAEMPPERLWPLTISLSRESGSRGESIARRVGQKLGRQVYTQDLLEFMATSDDARQALISELPQDAIDWADDQMKRLRHDQVLRIESEISDLTYLILLLAVRGESIVVGRGAGYVLPPELMLHVRIVAPLPDRIAYFSQTLRLTREQAAEEVRHRDQRRAEFLASEFRRPSAEPHAFDLFLNSARLGEELAAELIINALRGKEALRDQRR